MSIRNDRKRVHKSEHKPKAKRMTNDQSQWIAEGWRSFQDEVLIREWLDHPYAKKLQLLLELSFYGGANWLIHILEEEGTTTDVIGRLTIELTAHQERMARMARAIDEDSES